MVDEEAREEGRDPGGDGSGAWPGLILSHRPTGAAHAGEFEVTATVRREGRLYPAQARGKLVVDQGRQVRVTLTEMKVSGGDVPQMALEKELLKINPILDLSRFPLDLRIQRLTLHNDQVELLAVSGP